MCPHSTPQSPRGQAEEPRLYEKTEALHYKPTSPELLSRHQPTKPTQGESSGICKGSVVFKGDYEGITMAAVRSF